MSSRSPFRNPRRRPSVFAPAPTWMNRPHTLGSRAAGFAMRLAGWDLLLVQPPGPKLVAVAAPHTANADFWPGIFWRWATRTPVQWVAKAELFANPIMGAILKSWGGVPVHRGKTGGNFVSEVVQTIKQSDEIMLNVAPEGTRKYRDHWKSGFYYMALGAGVPIAVVVMDWGKKAFGIVGYVQPTGDIEADFAEIRGLMQGVRAHTQANAAPIVPGRTTRAAGPTPPERTPPHNNKA